MTDPDQGECERLQDIFLRALEVDAGAAREAFLNEACGSDREARASLETRLREYEADADTLVATDVETAVEGSPAPDRSGMFVPGHILADRYRIVSLLGGGGMGEVYRADDLQLGQAVALKFLPPELADDPALLKALRNEVRQARLVSHRHVCRVYDIGEAEGVRFVSMEYIEGEHLGSLLRRIGRLPGSKVIELALQLCAGLEAAHQQGVLHLDLKPANLMIDGNGELRIADFGLARLVREADLEKRRDGTPAYMAPEQLMEGVVSQRSDIFAVGLILYEMFTGKRMHAGRRMGDIVAWHQAGGVAQLRSGGGSGLDPAVEECVLGCASANAEDRPESVGAILAELDRLGPVMSTRNLQDDAVLAARTQPVEAIKESDVFIAYAPIDDKPLLDGKPGWIEQFHDHLQVRLEQLSGESVKIWRDGGRRSEQSDEQLLELLPFAKTMVSVMSPPFVKTPECLREVEEYWQSAERNGTFRVSDKTRILKVMKTPVPDGLAPPDVERLMSQLAGFEFYENDPETGRWVAYDETFGARARQCYFERIYDLAYEVRDVLQALRGAGGAVKLAPEGKTIYLAETTTDLQSGRDKLKRELLENGFRVVPELPLPLVKSRIKREVSLLLEASDFAVHLVGANYGMVPEDTEDSVVKLQNQLAAARSRSEGLERLIWIPRGVEPRDERQKRFVRSLIEDPDAHFGAEVVQDSLENFKEILLEQLTPVEEEPLALAAPRNADAVSTIYLIYDRRDEEAVEPLEDMLFELGFEVTSPSFEGDEKEVSRVHQHNLQHCDGALVFYGSVSKPWVDMKLMDIVQAPGYGRSKELLAKAVYVAPSDDRRKTRFRTHLADIIRPGAGVDEGGAAIEAFANQLRQEVAG